MQTRLTSLETEQMLAAIQQAQVRAESAFHLLQGLIRKHVEGTARAGK